MRRKRRFHKTEFKATVGLTAEPKRRSLNDHNIDPYLLRGLTIDRKLQSYKALDLLCLTLISCVLIYELPATAIAQIGASFGMFEAGVFYVYRLNFAVFVIGVASLNILINHRYLFSNRYFLLYLLLVSYMLLIVWLNREVSGPNLGWSDPEIESALTFFLPIIFKYIVFFLVGLYLPRLAKSKALFLCALFIIFLMVITHVNLDTLSLNTEDYIDPSYAGNRLFLGDATSIIALISLPFLSSNKAKIILTVLSAITLFFIGSRTSFAAFTATTVLYFILSFKPKFLLVSVICVIAAGVWLSSVNFDELAERNPRMFDVVTDFEDDRSVLGRKNLSADGWYDITNNLIMGNLGGQLFSGPSGNKGGWRSYMHNVFSYWRQFGILAFFIIVSFVARYYFTLWKNRNHRNHRIFALYFLVGLFLSIETAFSRSFAFPYAHLFFGLTVALNYTMVSEKSLRSLADRYYRRPGYQITSADRTPRKKKRRIKRKRRSRKKNYS